MLSHFWTQPAKEVLRTIRRELQLTPMKRILLKLKKRGIQLRQLQALEVFGASGESHVMDYAGQVSHLSIWEINPSHRDALTRRFPDAEVTITDSYAEMKRTCQRYNFILIDNPLSIAGGHCEHFDLFPDVFRIAADSAILVLNVIPEVNAAALRDYPYIFNPQQLAFRRAFYETRFPENIPLDEMARTYERLIRADGRVLEWHFFQKRNFVFYLVMKINKRASN